MDIVESKTEMDGGPDCYRISDRWEKTNHEKAN